MKKALIGAIAALSCVVSAVPAAAQYRDRDGRPDRHEWNRDRDRDGRHDRWDRRDHRRDYRWRNYGGRYGYNGYRGHWRTGQRYTYWNNHRYYVNDWRAYDLPPPRRGYRYYRDDNGDIVLAAIGTGIIAMILAGR